MRQEEFTKRSLNMPIIRNESNKPVVLKTAQGAIKLDSCSAVERSDVSNLNELNDSVKVTANLTEVCPHVTKSGNNVIHG